MKISPQKTAQAFANVLLGFSHSVRSGSMRVVEGKAEVTNVFDHANGAEQFVTIIPKHTGRRATLTLELVSGIPFKTVKVKLTKIRQKKRRRRKR